MVEGQVVLVVRDNVDLVPVPVDMGVMVAALAALGVVAEHTHS